MLLDLAVSVCAFCVGILVGLTGMGGGSVMTALLILVFGVHPITAVGTDLLYAAVTKITGTGVHWRNGNVDWRIVGLLAMGSAPASLLSLWFLSNAPSHSPEFARAISIVIGAALLLAAASLVLRIRPQQDAAEQSLKPGSVGRAPSTIGLGLVLGVLVPLTSVGAGALGMAVLCCLYPRLPAVRLVGSDIAHAVPLTLVAGAGHWLIGNVDWSLFASLVIGSVPGIMMGSHFAHQVPERRLLPMLGIVLALIGGRLVMS